MSRKTATNANSVKSNADGSFSLNIAGEPAWTYRIHGSTDLIRWTLLRELRSTGWLLVPESLSFSTGAL